jgi:hypothetical protein
MKVFASSALLLTGSALLLAGSLVAPVHADTVTLNNGREIHGRLVEEGAKVILIKTGSGVITIPKFKVATFSENENWGNYSKPRSVAQLKAIEAANRKAAAEAAAKKGGKTGDEGPKKGSKKGAEEDGGWAWGEDVDKAAIEELTPIRDEIQQKLKDLGPTKEERLKGLGLSREEIPDLKEKIRLLGWKRGRGRRGGIAGSQVYREKAKKEIIATYGVRAISHLVKVLGSENLFQARTAAQTLQGIHAGAKDPKASLWLMNHFEVPTGLVMLLDNEGDPISAFIRLETNQALEGITGSSAGWPTDAKDPRPSTAETRARKKWRRWNAKNSLAFTKSEETKAAERALFAEQLEQLREGKNPLEEEKKD